MFFAIIFTEDIIYKSKYSHPIIDKKLLKIQSNKIVQQITVDVSIFDQ
jgi:hypothetical protein